MALATRSDDDHPLFDNDGLWPRRLLQVSTMTSHKWQPGNRYGRHKNPKYHAISYTWGRWRLRDGSNKPSVSAISIGGVPWDIPRIDPDHFTVQQFEAIIKQAIKARPPAFRKNWTPWAKIRNVVFHHKQCCNFLWLDIACIDQRDMQEARWEVGRQARIFRGAHHVYVWLNHLSFDQLSRLSNSIRTAVLMTMDEETRLGNESKGQSKWYKLACESFGELVLDPWFSSLWTLQEAFLCPEATLLSRHGHHVEEGSYSPLVLNHLFSRAHSLDFTLQGLDCATDTSQANSDTDELQSNRSPGEVHLIGTLKSILENSGLVQLWHQNPLATLGVAQYRKTEFSLDRVYAIMQIFGDDFKVGSSAKTAPQLHRETTVEDLEDEVGALLIEKHPVLSQLFVHEQAPPFGRGWRFSRSISIPHFASNVEKFQTGDNLLGGSQAVCQMSTRVVDGHRWGFITTRACIFEKLQKACQRQFCLSKEAFQYTPLSLALDRMQRDQNTASDLPDISFAQPSPQAPEVAGHEQLSCMIAEHEAAQRLAARFSRSSDRFIMALLGQRVCGSWIMEGESVPYRDMFYGLMLVEQECKGLQYWQRIGICRWTSYNVKATFVDDDMVGSTQSSDKDILLGRGVEWQHLEGIFG
jgi:Heterokaryon incompatibility protein (HET)